MVVTDEAEVLRRASALFDQACTAKDRGQPEKSVELLEQALSSVSSRLGENNQHYCDLLTGLTLVHFQNLKNKNPDKARACSRKFLQMQTQRCGLPLVDPTSQIDHAWQLYDLGRFCQWSPLDGDANTCFLQAIILGTEPGYTSQMDVALGCLGFNRSGELSMNDKDLQMAEHDFTVAMNSSQRLGDRTLQLITNTNIAKLCFLAGNSSRAKSFYQQAVALVSNGANIRDTRVIESADTYLTLAALAKQFRLNKEGAKLIDIAGQIVASEAAEVPLYAPLVGLVASEIEDYGEPKRAGALHESVFQQGSTTQVRLNGLLGMARCSGAQGIWNESEETFDAALKLANSVGPQYEALVLQTYAKTLKSSKRRLLDAANMEAKAKAIARAQ